jgi:hypothetical protein
VRQLQRFDKNLFRLFIEGLARRAACCLSSKPEAVVERFRDDDLL